MTTLIQTELNFFKETPGTYRYKEPMKDNPADRPCIDTIYIRKSLFHGAPPKKIKIVITDAN